MMKENLIGTIQYVDKTIYDCGVDVVKANDTRTY